MSVTVVGSIALDTVTTPFGTRKEVLGGSAAYFSLSASYFTSVNLVATIGEDFPEEYINLFKANDIDLSGLTQEKGKTFRWEGIYSKNLNHRKTKNLELNVFAEFKPKIPNKYKKTKILFLANIDPELQKRVLKQTKSVKLIACDTMEHWIKEKKNELTYLLPEIDCLIINESEAKELSQSKNLIKAAKTIKKLGPKIFVIKKGTKGADCFFEDKIISIPAYPVRYAKDPTGAGDSFAGGFLGYLASNVMEGFSLPQLKEAMIYGTIMASFTVEEFSTKGLIQIKKEKIEKRRKILFKKDF